MTGTAVLYRRDGSSKTFELPEISRMASRGQVGAGKEWSAAAPLPPGWDRETPKYRVTRDIRPAQRARYRLEPPFEPGTETDTWQYGERALKAREIIETRSWPHSSFFPLNDVARKILDFFNSRMKSRLPNTPFDHRGALRLDDGMSGPAPRPQPVHPTPFDMSDPAKRSSGEAA